MTQVTSRDGTPIAYWRSGEGPTLLLSGSESPSGYRMAVEAVDEALPDSRIVVMPGQGHVAMDTGTDLFTTQVLRFTEGL